MIRWREIMHQYGIPLWILYITMQTVINVFRFLVMKVVDHYTIIAILELFVIGAYLWHKDMISKNIVKTSMFLMILSLVPIAIGLGLMLFKFYILGALVFMGIFSIIIIGGNIGIISAII